MKFLCIECDEAMKLTKTSDTEDGSINVVFKCPNCAREIAMLTNSMEAQLVRSMDVKIGGRTTAAEPMGKLRSSLISKKDEYRLKEDSAENINIPSQASAAKCPFPEMITQMDKQNFSAVQEISWTEGARARIMRIPDFVRDMVSKGIEQHAREKGYKEIDESVMDEVKGNFGM